MNRHARLALLCVLTIAFLTPAVVTAPPGKTYQLRQTFQPGTYYTVTNVDTRQKKTLGEQTDSETNAPEMNVQQIWVVKMIVGQPDEKGSKSIAMTFERFQQTTNMGGEKVAEYDSLASNAKNDPMDQFFAPLRKAIITIVLDKQDNVVSIEGLEGIWNEQETPSNAKPMINRLKKSFNVDSLKKMILFSRDFLPAKPVAVGESWSNEQTLPTMVGNATMPLNMTFTSVDVEEGCHKALIVFSGKTQEIRRKKNTSADSRDRKISVDFQQKGMLRFDITAGRIAEANVMQTMVFILPDAERLDTEDASDAASVKITIQSGIAMKEYMNQIPPELTAPPAPATVPAKE